MCIVLHMIVHIICRVHVKKRETETMLSTKKFR